MKITKRQLRRIIKEAISDGCDLGEAIDVLGAAVFRDYWKGASDIVRPGENFGIARRDRSSMGNRYVDTKSLLVRFPKDDATQTMTAQEASKNLGAYGSVGWRTIFNALGQGVFVGETLSRAVCDVAGQIQGGEVDEKEVRRLLNTVGAAMWTDANAGTLFSADFEYFDSSHKGWRRST